MIDARSEPALSELLHAAANADRLRILSELASRGQPLCINEIAISADLNRIQASRHLAVMRACGLVDVHQIGLRKMHTLSEAALLRIEDWVIGLTE